MLVAHACAERYRSCSDGRTTVLPMAPCRYSSLVCLLRNQHLGLARHQEPKRLVVLTSLCRQDVEVAACLDSPEQAGHQLPGAS